MPSLKPLIAELESAKEGSRELSDRVLLACGWRYEKIKRGIGFSGKPKLEDAWLDPTRVPWTGAVKSKRPSPTESLDDAVAVVPEGWEWGIGSGWSHKSAARPPIAQLVYLDMSTGKQTTITENGNTPVLALCIAALKTRDAA